jgi:signal transduction histidine kinase
MKKQTGVGHHDQQERNERMVAALAHEIRNPLNSMKGASQYLHDKYPGENDISEFTGIIIDEINRLERYLNEFLSFSRGMSLKLTEVTPENFISGIVLLIKHNFPCEIKITISGGPMPHVFMDQEQMRQVFVNLFSNASDALKDIADPYAEIILEADKKYVRISLIDNGRGIKKADLKKIFEPFFSTKESGIGIGLPISRSIIKKHDGLITAESRPGSLTKFTISIPVEKRKVKR